MSESPIYLLDACVVMDGLLAFRSRHDRSAELFWRLESTGASLCIPSHAFFEYAASAITHFKHEPEKLPVTGLGDALPRSLRLRVIPLNKEYIMDLLGCLGDKPIPDLKSADMIYFCISKLENIPLITEDRKLRSQCRKGGLEAVSIEEAIAQLDVILKK